MEVLLYAGKKDPSVARLEEMMKRSFDHRGFTICWTMNSLSRKLLQDWNERKTLNEQRIVVFFIFKKEELSRIDTIRDLLWNVYLIIILPDNHIETLYQAHRFFPRYLSSIDSSFKDVIAVLTKMMQLTPV